jgi:hypothetical protein
MVLNAGCQKTDAPTAAPATGQGQDVLPSVVDSNNTSSEIILDANYQPRRRKYPLYPAPPVEPPLILAPEK